jgi:cytochrome c biogenesis factor
VLYLLTYLLTTKISLNTNFFDLITNVYINDFYLNSFYFIWTQFFILPSLLIIIHYKHTVNVLKYKNYITVTLIYATLIVLVWGVVDYYWTNQYLFINKNSQYFFNNLLNNPLNKYHPVLFFTSYLFIYNLASYLSSTTNDRYCHFYKNPQQINTNLLTNKINLFWTLMLFSLYLGAWWALQEGSWGGWWNWDASEVFGLLILTYLVLILHYK